MVSFEELVENNRFNIAVVFPFTGASLFILSSEGILPEYMAFNSLLILFGTFVMRSPLIAGLKPLVDKRAAAGIIAISAYSYLIEYIGLRTGWPYGEFIYNVSLGPMIYGVPLGLPLFFVPLAFNSYILTCLFKVGKPGLRIPSAVSILLLVDMVLDPAAVSTGLWSYKSELFYGVPVSNFIGWMISGLVAITVIELSFSAEEIVDRLKEAEFMLDDFVSFVLLWGFVNLYYFNWIPVLSTAFIALLLHKKGRLRFLF